ncbi:MAG: DUF3786 domain-containing protein [Armatimonadetes bacterium]|nr:DUF3786 domain-containing protein [Armatimonadota bacterium]
MDGQEVGTGMREYKPGQIPPPQRPYEQAFELGFEALALRAPTDAHLIALGAERSGNVIKLPVLHRQLLIDQDTREVSVEGGGKARLGWAILALHYLCASDLSDDPREFALGHFTDCRSYVSVFNNRIVRRFLATAGKDAKLFAERAEQIGGVLLERPGMAYSFSVLPRVPIVIVRYEGDYELGPGASVIFRADAEHLLPAEDRIVAAELLLDSLSGKSIDE